jgi:mannose-binding lectin 2
MMGDGKTKYDHDNDNADNEIGGCSVRLIPLSVSVSGVCGKLIVQEHFRRRDFPTKARLTYLKSSLLQVSACAASEWVRLTSTVAGHDPASRRVVYVFRN